MPEETADHRLLHVDPLLAELRERTSSRLRERLLRRGAPPEFADEEIFDFVESLFRRALDAHDDQAFLLPAMIGDDDDLRLETAIRFRSHRPWFGRLIITIKRYLLMPLTRWLFEYAHDNFERQQRINQLLLACIQVLAADHARACQQLRQLRAAAAPPPAESAPQ